MKAMLKWVGTRKVGGRVVVAVLLLLTCTNFAGAELDTGVQPSLFLPVSWSTAVEPTPTSSQATGVNFILDLEPLWYLFSPDADGFKVERSGAFTYESEEIVGWGSILPNARAGVRINTPKVAIDLTGGGGYLWNNVVSAPFVMGDVGVNFRVGRNATIGPHFSVLSIDELEWAEDADVVFSDTTGYAAGFVFISGDKTFNLRMAIDYFNADFDVQTGSGWTANSDTLDLSGVAFQLSFLLKF